MLKANSMLRHQMKSLFDAPRRGKNSRFCSSNCSSRLNAENLEERILLASDLVRFDPTPGVTTPGSPGDDSFLFTSMDFSLGSALVSGYDELIADPDLTGDLLFQAKLNSFLTPSGNVPVDFPGAPYEITLVARFTVQISGTSLLLSPTQSADAFGATLYYDSTPDAVELAGTGFDNGDVIFDVDIESLLATSTLTATAPIPGLKLDNFGANDLPGVTTAVAGGIVNAIGDPFNVNSGGAFLHDPVTATVLTDNSFDIFRFNTTLTAPFSQQNPSKMFFAGAGGFKPSYDSVLGIGTVNADGVIDGVAGNPDGDDILLQADANGSFQYALASIHGFKYEDLTKNGQYDPGLDPPFPGIEFELWNDLNNNGLVDGGDDLIGTEVTDQNGAFWFTELCSGHYILREVLTDPDVMPSTADQILLTVEAGTNYVWQPGASNMGPVGQVTARQVFYNNSIYDGNGLAVAAAVDVNAIDPTKTAYTTAATMVGAANITTYNKGVNGIRVDVDNAAGPLTLADFSFSVGDSQNTLTWTPIAAAAIDSVMNGTTWETYITFADGTILNKSLKVQVLANPNTRLPIDDLHYWSNKVGDAVGGDGIVGPGDVAATVGPFGQSVGISANNDYNKDGVIAPGDVAAVVGNFGSSIVRLNSTDITECPRGTYGPNEEVVPELAFGNFVKGSIHGFKFDDYEGDGVFDPNGWDLPFGGIGFQLFMDNGNMQFDPVSTSNPDGDTLVGTQTSDEYGRFWFEDLMPGDYFISELPSWPGVMPSTPTVSQKITILSGQELVWQPGEASIMSPLGPLQEEVLIDPDGSGYDENLMFGNYVKGSIHALKFEDYNGNGIYDPNNGDTPWNGFEFLLTNTTTGETYTAFSSDMDLDGDGNIDPLTESGMIWFNNLIPGTYVLSETGQYDLDGDGNLDPPNPTIVPKTPTDVTVFVGSREELVWQYGVSGLPSGSPQHEVLTPELVFGNAVLGSIHGFKCEDLDADGTCNTLIAGDMPHVVFIVDNSGSTGSSSGFDIDGDGNNDTILEVELAGVKQLIMQLDGQFGADAEISIVIFNSSATSLDMDPNTAGVQIFAPADALAAGDIDTVLAGVSPGGGTSYVSGLNLAKANIDLWMPDINDTNVIFLSDGAPGDSNAAITAAANNVATVAGNIRAIGVGTGAPLAPLSLIDIADGSDDAIVFDMPGDLIGFFTGGGGGGGGAGDPAFPGVPFSLLGADGNYYDEFGNIVGPNYYLTTNEDGEFWFTGLMPMQYTVLERTDLFATLFPNDNVMPSSATDYTLFVGSREEHVWRPGAAMLDPQDPFELRVETEPEEGLIFANYVKGSIHGFKFHDVDLDGLYDPAIDEVFPGVVFDLYDENGNNYRLLEEGFEGGVIPVGWSTDGIDPDGFIDPDDLWGVDGLPPGPLDGSFSAHAGFGLENDESSWIQYTGLEGPGIIQFDFQMDSEAFFDFMSFQVDSGAGFTTLDSWSGSESGTAWFRLPTGTHDLRWRYDKDSSVSVGTDTAAIDNVVFYTTSDENGRFWYTDLVPGDYTVVEYPDAFTNFAGEVMSTTHEADLAFVPDHPNLGDVAVTQVITIRSGQEKVGLDGDAMLPTPTLREEMQTDDLRFGNFIKGSIHAFKYEDLNADGVYDPIDDSPWAGFEFELWIDDGDGVFDPNLDTFVGSQLSDNGGQVWFTGLLPTGSNLPTEGDPVGEYILVETELFDSDGDGNSDEVNGEIMSSEPDELVRFFTVGSGEELVWQEGAAMLDPTTTPVPKHEVLLGDDLMFGNYVKGSIHGFKFEDYNGNGSFDQSDDTGFGGIPFNLYYSGPNGTDPETLIETQLTAYDGKFWFTDLVPGYYRVAEDLSGLPWGNLVMPSNADSREFFVGSRQELVYKPGEAMITEGSLKEEVLVGSDLKYGNVVKGSIHGFKCEDVDADGACETTAHAVYVIDASGSMSAQGNFLVGDVDFDGYDDTKLDLELAVLSNALVDLDLYAASLPGNTAFHVSVVVMQNGTAYSVDLDPVAAGDQWFVSPGEALTNFYSAIVAEIASNNLDGFGHPSGDTNLQAGIDLAAARLAGWNSDAHTGNVYFFSDGYDNVGGGPVDASGLAPVANNVQAYGVGPDENLSALGIFDPDATTVLIDFLSNQYALFPSTHPDFNGPELPMENVEFVITGTTGLGDPYGPVSVFTNADGEFWQTELYPGNYTVTEVIPEGMQSSTGDTWSHFIGSGEEYAWAEGHAMIWPGLQTEEVDSGLIFGNYTPIDLVGMKFNDLNGDGINNGDPGMGGVTIELVQNNVVIDSFLTGPDGLYWFLGLDPGTYTVREVQPHPDVVPSTPDSVEFTVYSGDPAVYVEFGNVILGSLHGFKFEDYNGNGIYEPQIYVDGNPTVDLNPDLDGFQADSPWEGFEFDVTGDFDGDGVDTTIRVTTDANGEWWLTADNVAGGLYPGNYQIAEVALAGTYVTTGPSSVIVTVQSGDELVWTPGASGLLPHDPQHEVPAPELAFGNAYYASVHGKVFNDLNGNGVQDPNETPLGGATVQLLGPSGPQQMQTAFDGLYWFTNLRVGDYSILSLTNGYVQTSINEAFAGSGEAVVHKIEPNSPSNAVIHGDGHDLRVGLQQAVPILGGGTGTLADAQAARPAGIAELRANIGDIGYVRRLSEQTFASLAADEEQDSYYATRRMSHLPLDQPLEDDSDLLTLLAKERVFA